MADPQVKIQEHSQNIDGVVTIRAPLTKAFEAYTNEKLFVQWWGRGSPMKVLRFDCVTGGSWHIADQAPDGNEHEFMGSCHEVTANQRVVQTFKYLGMPERGHVSLQRADFVAIDANSSEIRTPGTAQSREDRDGMVTSGMKAGWRQSVQAPGKLLEA